MTGGAGFIGSNLVRLLLDSTNHEVVNLDADQAFSNAVQLGSTSQGNGAATINIGATNTANVVKVTG